MYDLRSLKTTISTTNDTVECPVMGCAQRVRRMRETFSREPKSLCPDHRIYISPSTFEYEDGHSNFLPLDAPDRALLATLMGAKAEAGRLGRERSEDAFTFNVFRALERTGSLDTILSILTATPIHWAVPSYWSVVSATGETHDLLIRAREAFRERPKYGTEPDMLIETADTLILIEAKLGSTNDLTPASQAVPRGYAEGGASWFDTVFSASAQKVAVEEKFYQLMRCWLLGSWMAEQAQKRFVLISLVRAASDATLPVRFGACIRATNARQFVRATWEDILVELKDGGSARAESRITALTEYLENKTLGYDSFGSLQSALAVSRGRVRTISTDPARALDAPIRAAKSLNATATTATVKLTSARRTRQSPNVYSDYGYGPSDGLHVLKDEWAQRSFIGGHSKALRTGLTAAIAATRLAVQVRANAAHHFRIEVTRMMFVPREGQNDERLLEQRIYKAFGPESPRQLDSLGMELVHYQVPLFNSVSKKDRWGYVDLLAVTPELDPVVIELKHESASDSPFRTLVECAANMIAVEMNWLRIRDEIAKLPRFRERCSSLPNALCKPRGVLLAPPDYWRNWDHDGSLATRADANTRTEFKALRRELAVAGYPTSLATVITGADEALQIDEIECDW